MELGGDWARVEEVASDKEVPMVKDLKLLPIPSLASSEADDDPIPELL